MSAAQLASGVALSGYALAALSFMVLGAPLLARWERGHARLLTVACVTGALWAAGLSWSAARAVLWSPLVGTLELLRDLGWTAFLLALQGQWRAGGGHGWRRLHGAAAGTLAVYAALLGLTLAGGWQSPWLAALGRMPQAGAHVLLAVYGMLLVEQVYRSRGQQERWAVKFVCLGVGGMFAYDLYLYSHAMLLGEPDAEIWAARGLVNALAVPLLAVSLGRSRSWTPPLALSRRVVYHSAALFGSAAYLLAMGFAAYFLRFLGGRWGAVMQVVFLCGALALLGVVLFSGTFRARLKVFISKHFYSYNYDYREEWLRFTRTLAAPGPRLGERAIEAVAALVESPGGVLFQRGAEGAYEPAASWQAPTPAAREAADAELAVFLQATRWVIDVDECRRHPEKYEGLALPAWLDGVPRAALVVPLILQGSLFGFVVLQRSRSPVKLNWEVIDLLGIAGSQAASHLAQHEAAQALMVARQFESFNRMSTFVVHDLKNLVAQLSLMNANAERHGDNPEFQRDMQDTLRLSVQKMKLLLQKLGRSATGAHPALLALDEVVAAAVALKAPFAPRPVLAPAPAGLMVLADRERLERVLGHLLQNAIEASAPDGRVSVRLSAAATLATLEIEDSGAGMSEAFIRERLFKPFDSTKSAGMGIGAFESREYIRELGGRLDVRSTPGAGTTFTVLLPLCAQQAQPVERAA